MISRAQAITDGETVLATVEVGVPPQRAFEVMTSAEVQDWWGAPALYRFTNWRSDLRAGGKWRVDVCLPSGAVHPASGEYLTVQAPHLVTLTRRYDWDHPSLGRRMTRVAYRFEPIEGGTRITVRQDDFGSQDAAAEHAGGWQRTLEFLQAYLAERHGSRPDAARFGGKTVFGNHMSVLAPRQDRDGIRKFYCDVLGGRITQAQADRDFLQLGESFYAVLYGDVPDASEFLRSARSVWLELKSDDVEGMRRRILDSGLVRKLDIPDPHLYFQAPGGQCLRLVGRDEDLSFYEGTGEGPSVAGLKDALARESN